MFPVIKLVRSENLETLNRLVIIYVYVLYYYLAKS